MKALVDGGPAELWEKIKDDLSNLKERVIDAIQDWIVTTIVKKAVAKIVSMFNPAGAIIQAIMMIASVVSFVVERAAQIMDFVESVVNSIAAIASGAIGGAATLIEKALGNMVPILIGFLASLIGLGGISEKIKEFIKKVQAKVDKAIDKAIAKIVGVVKKLFGGKGKDKGKSDERTDAEKQKALKDAVNEADKFLNDEETSVEDVKKKLVGIRTKYKLTSLTIQSTAGSEDGQEIDQIEAVINPKIKGPPIRKLKPHPSKAYVSIVGGKYMLKPAYQNKTFTRDMCYAKSFRTKVISWKNGLLSKSRATGGLRHTTKLDHYWYNGQYYKNEGNIIRFCTFACYLEWDFEQW